MSAPDTHHQRTRAQIHSAKVGTKHSLLFNLSASSPTRMHQDDFFALARAGKEKSREKTSRTNASPHARTPMTRNGSSNTKQTKKRRSSSAYKKVLAVERGSVANKHPTSPSIHNNGKKKKKKNICNHTHFSTTTTTDLASLWNIKLRLERLDQLPLVEADLVAEELLERVDALARDARVQDVRLLEVAAVHGLVGALDLDGD